MASPPLPPPGPPPPPGPGGRADPGQFAGNGFGGSGPQPESSPPACYRHPGRPTYVSCVRCGRPACPDCLRPAAVGQQCVECIREGNRTVRRPAGAFGGRAGSGAAVTWVTWSLVGLNIACYLAEIIDQNTVYVGGVLYNPYVADGQYYRLISNAFLHDLPGNGIGLLHIAFNMWALIVVGPALERTLGKVRFVSVYFVSALGGSVLYYLIGQVNLPALGASGAIFGLFGAWFVVARRLRADTRQIVGLIVLNLVISFVGMSIIAWQAHVGGLIAGVALTAAYVYAPRRGRGLIQAAATVAILAVLVLAVVARDYQLAGTVRL